jgi:flagellar protein FlaJ
MEEEEGIKARLKAFLEGNSDPKLEAELPFASMMITLMAASGITPYESFKRMRGVDVLEKFRAEGDEIVRLVEVLGYDPLTAMERRAEETISQPYSEFLEGYISSVKSGASVINYLKSKLRGIFDEHAAKARNAVERLETLVETYMVMLIVIFCFYILSSVTAPATNLLGASGLPDTSALVYPLVLFVIPIFTFFFMYLANNSRPSTLKGMREPYLAFIVPGSIFGAFFAGVVLLPQLSFITDIVDTPLLLTAGLVAICVPPTIVYSRIARKNFSAERAMPSLMRDITEARRTGLSPEKSIVHAAGRRGYGPFTENLRRITNQIEWGVSLRKIFSDLKELIRSWPVVVDFFILVETIEIGGGDANTLGILAEYSEKIQTVEKTTTDMLKPYIILPFVWTVLMAFTVTFTIQTLAQIPSIALGTIATTDILGSFVNTDVGIIETGIVFHSWLSGFFIGKVSEGNFASGFKYAAFLAITAFATLILSRGLVVSFFRGML